MAKSSQKKPKIAFLTQDIEKLDAIINQYKEIPDNSRKFMLEQYEFRREKLYRLLCIELLSLPLENSVHFLPLVKNIANLYLDSPYLQANIRYNIQRWGN